MNLQTKRKHATDIEKLTVTKERGEEGRRGVTASRQTAAHRADEQVRETPAARREPYSAL